MKALEGKIKGLIILQFVIILVLVVMFILTNQIKYVEYATMETSEEVELITDILEKNGLSYKVKEHVIFVDESQVLTADLLSSSMIVLEGTDLEEQKTKHLIQGKVDALAIGLETVPWIEKASVDYYLPSVPEGDEYDEKVHGKSYMSVILKTNDNQKPDEEMVSLVVDFLINSTSNLKKENITIVDVDGQILYHPTETSDDVGYLQAQLNSMENAIKATEEENKYTIMELEAQAKEMEEILEYYKDLTEELERLYIDHPNMEGVYEKEIVRPITLDVEKGLLTIRFEDNREEICILDQSCQLIAPALNVLVYEDFNHVIEFLNSIIMDDQYSIEIFYTRDEKTNQIMIYHVKMI